MSAGPKKAKDPMRKRSRSREFALQILYQADLGQMSVSEASRDFWLERSDLTAEEKNAIDAEKDVPEIREYTEKLVRGVAENAQSLDAVIERFAENWSIARMAFVDRNILRLAAYEIIYIAEIPVKVAINEAVELAKRYGEPDSSKFVNGILDKVAKLECKK